MQTQRVRALLMGGQACVFYGAAQFSRDVDLVVFIEPENLGHLRAALQELQAETIAVPPFETPYLEKGHVVHFRCQHPEAAGIRVDLMARMRGVAPFAELWARRTTMADDAGCTWDLLALPDLVAAKKTQRDKDWPMIRALVEAHYFANRNQPAPAQIEFWLREGRTPELLTEWATQYRDAAVGLSGKRPALAAALAGDSAAIHQALHAEAQAERVADEAYWRPLKQELEQLRHSRRDGQ